MNNNCNCPTCMYEKRHGCQHTGRRLAVNLGEKLCMECGKVIGRNDH